MLTLQRLHEIFEHEGNPPEISVKGTCYDCRRDLEVVVAAKDKGWEILGGAIYEIGELDFRIKCDACFKAKPKLTNYKPCEVYDRVVGYLRPRSQMNPGKLAEVEKRCKYNIQGEMF